MRPMKAEDVICPDGKHSEKDLQFPLYASPKLDGIRALVINGELLTSKLKLIPNKHVREMFSKYEGLDGELLVRQSTMEKIYRNTASAVMSRDGTPDVVFHVFDRCDKPDTPFIERWESIHKKYRKTPDNLVLLDQKLVFNLDQLKEYEEFCLKLCCEGVMLRHPQSGYKYGRSTWKQHWLLKLKRFQQDEAIIIGFEEEMMNMNKQKVSELGLKKRSSHKANMKPKGRLGALVVKSKKYKKEFTIGGGFDTAEREEIWNNQKKYMGKLVTFKYFAYGDYDVPRHPTFIGIRERSTL